MNNHLPDDDRAWRTGFSAGFLSGGCCSLYWRCVCDNERDDAKVFIPKILKKKAIESFDHFD